MTHRFFLITGCSGGGKSTLLSALGARGYAVVPEPGRRIVDHQAHTGGDALPWVNPVRFVRRALDMARADLSAAAEMRGSVFFDRGVLDAAVALAHLTGTPLAQTLGSSLPYAAPIFVAPPWAEMFTRDAVRQHDFASAQAEYDRITKALADLGANTRLLPKTSIQNRVSFVLDALPGA